MKNFWSLLKRCLKGTSVSVEPFHLFRYLDEEAFRFNNRKGSDAGRFVASLQSIVGKRIEYKKLIWRALIVKDKGEVSESEEIAKAMSSPHGLATNLVVVVGSACTVLATSRAGCSLLVYHGRWTDGKKTKKATGNSRI